MEKKRNNIGLIVGNIEDVFSNQVCKGAMRAAKLMDDNLFIFPVKYLDQDAVAYVDPKQYYEYQYRVLLSYAKSKSLDMVLICLSSIGYRSTREKCMEVLHSFEGIPVMLIASEEEGTLSIKYDNVTGLREGIEYLIQKKKRCHIGMLTGMDSNKDAVERRLVYRQTLEENGIAYNERMVKKADFSDKCAAEVEELLRENSDLDAIVCGNDLMAKAAYQVLARYHFKIGRDICVLGFDDIEESARMAPPLATVRADASLLGYRAVMEGHEILQSSTREQLAYHPEGGKKKHFIVETQFILRESASGVFENGNTETADSLAKYQEKLQIMIDMNHRMNIVNRDMLMLGSSEQNYSKFMESFSMKEIENCYLFLLHEPCTHDREDTWEIPHAIYLKAFRNLDQVSELPRSRQRLTLDELYRNEYMPQCGRCYVVIDVYSREQQYGILMCDMPYRYFHYAEMLCYQISIAIKMMELFATQKRLLDDKEDMLRKLEQENLVLDNISNKDELTGILNTRGFLTRVDDMLRNPENYGKKAIMLYADLNYLKQINDRYSHMDGNFAIISCARAMEQILNSDGVAGRVGGDEFAGCMFIHQEGDGERIKREIKEYLNQIHETSGKPYIVMTSIGVLEFEITEETKRQTLLEQADDLLYEDKALKGPFVVREAGQ